MDLNLDLSSFASEQVTMSTSEVYDVLIIGGGAAGLNAALYAGRKKLKVGIISEDIGGQIVKSASIENWIGDTNIASSTLINRFYEHVQELDVVINKDVKVETLECQGKIKKVHCSNGDVYQSKALIIASGKSPRMLNIEGEEEYVGKGVAYCTTCDGPMFKDKKVVVVGGGNSGVEAAIDMLSYAKEVVVIQNIDKLTADAVITDKLLSDSRVSVVYNKTCVRIEGAEEVTKLVVRDCGTGEEMSIDTDGIFVEIGLVPATTFVPQEIKNAQGEIDINANCSTAIEGIFGAGDVTTVPYKQVVIAAGEGAKAALSAYNYIITQ